VYMELDPLELTLGALRDDDLDVSQLVKDAVRAGYRWAEAPAPTFPQRRLRAVYAALVELFAMRDGFQPPAWTQDVEPAPAPVYLMPGTRSSARLRRYSTLTTPVTMRRRNVFAVRDYLDFTFGRSEKTSILPKEPMPWDTPEWQARARVGHAPMSD
jgi:hypothetical protein